MGENNSDNWMEGPSETTHSGKKKNVSYETLRDSSPAFDCYPRLSIPNEQRGGRQTPEMRQEFRARQSIPQPWQTAQSSRHLKFWQVMIFFGILFVVDLTIGGLIQYFLGMLGVAISQVAFLVLSVLFVFLMGADLKEVFPVQRPKGKGILGVLILTVAAFFMAEIVSVGMYLFFPEETQSMSDSMGSLMNGNGLLVEFIVTCFFPPFCEEALNRGVILNGSYNTFRSKWTVILINGAVFAVFHVYPIRYLIPFLLGMVLAWIVLTTNNMFYSSLLHCLYNVSCMLPAFFAGDTDTDISYLSTSALLSDFGILLIMFGIAIPILVYSGCRLLKSTAVPGGKISYLPRGREKKTLALIIVPTICILGVGIIALAAGLMAS